LLETLPRRRSYRRLPPVEAGLKDRYPRCGESALLAGFLKFIESYPACCADFCGENTEDEDAGNGPAVLVILLAGVIVIPMAPAFQLITQAPSWHVFLVWGAVLTVFCLFTLRLLGGVMFNMAWRHNASEVKASDIESPNIKPSMIDKAEI